MERRMKIICTTVEEAREPRVECIYLHSYVVDQENFQIYDR
jgi:hypothetical protein